MHTLFRYLKACLLILFISGCASLFRHENNDKGVTDLLRHMEASGVKVVSISPVLFEVIKAQDGLSLRISGKDVQIFKFDTKDKVQKDKLDLIYKTGEIAILGVNFAAKTNGSFVLLNYKNHPDEVTITEAFESF